MQSNKLWGKTNEAKNFTIFRTPHNISQSKKKLFEPSVISIGPFHHGQKHLRAMEEQKWRFLEDFLSRGNHLSLDLCISEMKLLEKRTRRCYNETVDLDSNAFVEMMLLDGLPKPEEPAALSSKSFDHTRILGPNIIKGLLTRRFRHSTSRNLSVALPNSTGNISSEVIPSATELKQKGLKFTPKVNPKHMLDISFEYGVLKIPKLKIGDFTKPIFANLIAFEHSKYGKKHRPFGRFVEFLDNLINTPNDVTILQECGIIENWLGSEEELAHFINHLTEVFAYFRPPKP
ncbi:UPF0481 protein At3g47200-like [Carex rostrata]